MLKGYAQRLQEQGNANNNLSAADIAEIEKTRIMAQAKAEILGMASRAKENRKDEAFAREAQRRSQQAQIDSAIKVQDAQTRQAIADAEAAGRLNRGQ
jgi:hypothetical protein